MKKKEFNKQTIIIIIMAVVLILIDQLSKIFIYNVGEINILNNTIKISVDEQKNVYSILTYIVQNIIVLGIIIKFLISDNQIIETKTKIFLNLILIGGIGNFIDRILRKCVVTFINIRIGNIDLPALNIAYICIIIGIIFMAGNFAIFTVKEMRNKNSGKIHS